MTVHHDRRPESRLSTSGDYEREAEHTRRRLAQNLDELSDRLTPGQVFDEMLTYSRAGSGTVFRAFSNAMRENPLPSLLIGAGCMMFLSEKIGLRAGQWRQADDGCRGRSVRIRRLQRIVGSRRRGGTHVECGWPHGRINGVGCARGLGLHPVGPWRRRRGGEPPDGERGRSPSPTRCGGRRRGSATPPQARLTPFGGRPMICATRLPARSSRRGAEPKTQQALFATQRPR